MFNNGYNEESGSRSVKAQLYSLSLPSLTSISLPPDRSFLFVLSPAASLSQSFVTSGHPYIPSWSINMFSEGIKRGLEVIHPLSISIVSLFAGIHHERRRYTIPQVSLPSVPKAYDDNTAEHRIQHTEGSITKPSMTTCFLESEEGSVSQIDIAISSISRHLPSSSTSDEVWKWAHSLHGEPLCRSMVASLIGVLRGTNGRSRRKYRRWYQKRTASSSRED